MFFSLYCTLYLSCPMRHAMSLFVLVLFSMTSSASFHMCVQFPFIKLLQHVHIIPLQVKALGLTPWQHLRQLVSDLLVDGFWEFYLKLEIEISVGHDVFVEWHSLPLDYLQLVRGYCFSLECRHLDFFTIQVLELDGDTGQSFEKSDLFLHKQVSSLSNHIGMRLDKNTDVQICSQHAWQLITLSSKDVIFFMGTTLFDGNIKSLFLLDYHFAFAGLANVLLLHYKALPFAGGAWSSSGGVHSWAHLHYLLNISSSFAPITVFPSFAAFSIASLTEFHPLMRNLLGASLIDFLQSNFQLDELGLTFLRALLLLTSSKQIEQIASPARVSTCLHPLFAPLIIEVLFLGIAKHIIGSLDLFEFLAVTSWFVWVVFHSKLPESLLYLIDRGSLFDIQVGIVTSVINFFLFAFCLLIHTLRSSHPEEASRKASSKHQYMRIQQRIQKSWKCENIPERNFINIQNIEKNICHSCHPSLNLGSSISVLRLLLFAAPIFLYMMQRNHLLCAITPPNLDSKAEQDSQIHPISTSIYLSGNSTQQPILPLDFAQELFLSGLKSPLCPFPLHDSTRMSVLSDSNQKPNINIKLLRQELIRLEPPIRPHKGTNIPKHVARVYKSYLLKHRYDKEVRDLQKVLDIDNLSIKKASLRDLKSLFRTLRTRKLLKRALNDFINNEVSFRLLGLQAVGYVLYVMKFSLRTINNVFSVALQIK